MSLHLKSIIGTLFFLVLSISYYSIFLYKKDISIFPQGVAYYTKFSDADHGRTSKVLKFNTSKKYIEAVFLLENKLGAYAGFNIYLKDSFAAKFGEYNSFKLNVETKNINTFAFSPRTFEKGISDRKNLESNRLNYQDVAVDKTGKITYLLNFNDFKIREWWMHHYTSDVKLSEQVDWNTAAFISFTPELIKDKSKPCSIKLHSLAVSKDNTSFFILIFGIISLYWLILFYVKRPKKKKEVFITHKNIEIESELEGLLWQEKIELYIGKEFTNDNLVLNDVAISVNKPSYVVSKYLKDKFNLSFKEYLNKIRLEEAKKLLLHSSLSVKEITFAVGFATTNHFTRVFRQEVGVPPSEFRSQTLS